MLKDKRYGVKELAEILNTSDRSVRRYLNELISLDKGVYSVSFEIVELLKMKYADNHRTTSGQDRTGSDNEEEYDVVEGFSNEEYQEFQKRLIEYPVLKQELEYHKQSADSHRRQMEKILDVFQQRNYLEASSKLNPNKD